MHRDFLLPRVTNIHGRISSITAAFFKAITPVVVPTDEEVDQVLAILGMSQSGCVCAYCGEKYSQWDHFRPIVTKKRPTGYITEIANLVPACGLCNQSKGAQPWETWMRSITANSPTKRRKADVEDRIGRLAEFEKWRVPQMIDYAPLVGRERFDAYLRSMDELTATLRAAQAKAIEIRELIRCGR